MSAVSKTFTPRSTARRTVATDSRSSVGPYEFPWAFPPIAHAPNPISETRRPVRPRIRVFITSANRTLDKNLCAVVRSIRSDADWGVRVPTSPEKGELDEIGSENQERGLKWSPARALDNEV